MDSKFEQFFKPHAIEMREFATANPIRVVEDFPNAIASGNYRRRFEYTNQYYMSLMLLVAPASKDGLHKMSKRMDTSLPFWFASATFINVKTGKPFAVQLWNKRQKNLARFTLKYFLEEVGFVEHFSQIRIALHCYKEMLLNEIDKVFGETDEG